MSGELTKIVNSERRATHRGSEVMKSTAEMSFTAESKVDSKEAIRVSAFSTLMKTSLGIIRANISCS